MEKEPNGPSIFTKKSEGELPFPNKPSEAWVEGEKGRLRKRYGVGPALDIVYKPEEDKFYVKNYAGIEEEIEEWDRQQKEIQDGASDMYRKAS